VTAVGLLVAAGATALIALGAPAGSADPALQEKIDRAQSEIEDLASQVESSQGRLADANQRKEAAAAREQELGDLLANGEERLAALRQRLEVTKQQLEESRARLARAEDALSERLIGIYKSGRPDAINVVLGANGFDDLITRVEYLKTIQQADEAIVARVRGLKEKVEAQHAEVQRLETETENYTERIAAAHDQIAGARAAAAAEAAALREQSATAGDRLGDLRSSIDEWQSRLPQLSNEQVGSWVGGYAIPTYIVMCESGGNYRALNPSSGAGGAYQILPSTWRAYGGRGLPHQASKAEQDRIAALIWANDGPGAWACA
jgi:peptidoglycan hydrolase CwlO-like protein